MGYVLLGIVAVTPEGYTAALFYMVSYVAMSLAAFSVLTLMSYHGIECETLEHLRGLNSRNSWLAFLMLLILFSMAGIPPLVGFFAKVLIFQALIHAHLVWLAAVGLACAIVGFIIIFVSYGCCISMRPIHMPLWHFESRVCL